MRAEQRAAAHQVVGGLRLIRVGTFSTPTHVTAPPGDASRVMVVERPGRIRVVRDGKVRGTPFLDIRGRVTTGGRARPARRWPSRRTTRQSGRFYVYYTDRAGDQRDRGVPAPRRGSRRRGLRAAGHADGRRASQPQRRAARVRAGRAAVRGHRRRRRDGDRHGARGNAQDLGIAARQDPAHRPAERRGRPYTIPVAQPLPAAGRAPAARSTRTACATRGGSPSTARPAISPSATSARTCARRSTSSGAAAATGPTSAGGRSRAAPATPPANPRRATSSR